MLLPLLEIVWADVIANVVADVIATFVLLGRCCAIGGYRRSTVTVFLPQISHKNPSGFKKLRSI